MKEIRKVWNSKQQCFVEVAEDWKEPRTENQKVWARFDCSDLMRLAGVSRIPLIAVLAEVWRRHFQRWNKNEPFALPSKPFAKLGFSPHDKIRALKVLEATGFIAVEWRVRKSPLIRVNDSRVKGH